MLWYAWERTTKSSLQSLRHPVHTCRQTNQNQVSIMKRPSLDYLHWLGLLHYNMNMLPLKLFKTEAILVHALGMPSVAYGLVVNNNDNDNNNITENKIRLWSISNPKKDLFLLRRETKAIVRTEFDKRNQEVVQSMQLFWTMQVSQMFKLCGCQSSSKSISATLEGFLRYYQGACRRKFEEIKEVPLRAANDDTCKRRRSRHNQVNRETAFQGMYNYFPSSSPYRWSTHDVHQLHHVHCIKQRRQNTEYRARYIIAIPRNLWQRIIYVQQVLQRSLRSLQLARCAPSP